MLLMVMTKLMMSMVMIVADDIDGNDETDNDVIGDECG
jgi:hypothetical protein